MVFEELEEQYESFAQPLRENGLPLPSFTMLLGIIALLIVLALAIYLNPFEPKSLRLDVEVLYGKEPVEKARVQLLDFNGNILTEAITSKAGLAAFESAPAKNLLVRASKEGIGEDEKEFSANPGKVTLVLGWDSQSANASIEITLSLLDDASGRAVPSAAVNYAFADEPGKRFKAVSQADGKASLTLPLDRAVNLVIEHPEYEAKSLSLKATKEKKNFEIRLHARSQSSSPNPSFTFEYGTLRVTVRDPFGVALDANIELYDATVNSLIDTKTASQGKAQFPNLLTGSEYYLKAKLESYTDYDGSFSKVEIGKKNDIEIVMRKSGGNQQGGSGSVTTYTVDEEGKSVNSKVQLISDDQVMLEKASSGKTAFERIQLNSLGVFSFTAIAESKLPALSEIYDPSSVPDEISLLMQAATPENSARLTVIVKGKTGSPAAGATLKVYSDTQGFLTSTLTDSYGSSQFLLAKDENYQIIAQYGGENGAADIFLDGDRSITIFLGEAAETLKVTAVDAITREEVEATFYSQYGESTFDSCFGSTCNLFVKSLLETSIRVTAEGHYERITAYTANGESDALEIDLIPLEFEGTFVKLLGIYDSYGKDVQDAQSGAEYTAKFLISAPFAEKVGAYFRVGEGTSAQSDIASIVGYSATPAASSLIKSKSYSTTSKCDDEPGSDFKWMNAEFENAETQEIGFRFKLSPDAERETEVPYYFRGYAVKDGLYLRIPEDEVLGTLERSAIVDWCKAQTSEGALSIRKEGAFSCGSIGCLSVSLEQDGLEGKDGFQARIATNCVSDPYALNSCSRGTLKIKARFKPNDAGKEFAVYVKQQNGRLHFTTSSINSIPQGTSESSEAILPLIGETEYSIIANSLPQESGAEKITVSVEEADSGVKVEKTATLNIYGSCTNGLKDCGNGRCELACLEDVFSSLTDEEKNGETIPPAPTCPAGQTYCNDGICRAICTIAATDRDELPAGINIDVTNNGNGNIIATNPLTGGALAKITMQIDAFVPADAIFLNTSGMQAHCTPLFNIAGGDNKACYSVQNNHLVFSGNELKPSCPIKTYGDQAIGDRGSKLKIACIDASIPFIEIPIEVSVKNIPFKTVQLQPATLSGSSAKVFHLINEKQVPKDYVLADAQISADFADAYTYAWSGDGTIELIEDGKRIDGVSYEREETYFPDIDNQGGRTPACFDYVCCASKWCTETA
ncbi:MAG: hypothetical protein ABH863_01025, partial [Candidatus Micrarchaeota archaeon]